MVRVESERHRLQPLERSDHQSRANEQHEGNPNLRDGEDAHRVVMTTVARGRAPAFIQCAV